MMVLRLSTGRESAGERALCCLLSLCRLPFATPSLSHPAPSTVVSSLPSAKSLGLYLSLLFPFGSP